MKPERSLNFNYYMRTVPSGEGVLCVKVYPVMQLSHSICFNYHKSTE